MAQYKVKDPQGNIRIIQGPDGATDEEVIGQAKKLFSNNPFQSITTSPTPAQNVISEVSEALKSSLLPNTETATQPLSGNPVEMLKQSLSPTEGLSRVGQTLRQPSVEAGQAVEQFGKDINAPITGKLGGMMTSAALDPATWTGTSLSAKAITEEAIPKAKNFLSGLGDMITGAFKEPPTQEEIEQATKAVQYSLVNARKTVGEKLGALRGTAQPAEARLEDIANKGVESYTPQEVAQQIQSHFKGLPETKAPIMGDEIAGATTKDIAEAPPLEKAPYTPATRPLQKGDIVTATHPTQPPVDLKLTMPEGQMVGSNDPGFDLKAPVKNPNAEWSHPVDSTLSKSTLESYGYKVPSEASMSPKEELDKLLKMRSNAYDQINASTLDSSGNMVKKIGSNDERAFRAGIDKINQRISNLPGGEKIRAAEQDFSEMSKIYDDLQSKMKDPGQAEGFLKRLFNNPTGKNKDYLNKLSQLQEVTKEPVIDNLFALYQKQARGFSYEALKHPFATAIKQGLPNIGGAIRTGIRSSGPLLEILPKGFPLSDEAKSKLQSLKDRLKNAK